MRDLIDRQEAIDMANDMYQGLSIVQASYSDIGRALVKFLNLVPSAQPDVPDRNVGDINKRQSEIVRCKNCKWYKTNYSWNGKEHKVCVIEPYEPIREGDDFCSRAERREE